MDKYISRKMFNKLNMDIDVEKHNKEFIENYLVNYEEYFDNMYKGVDANIKLDKEQRKCILNDEDYMMIIAGAGSGKTTTIAAKVKYLVEKNSVSPSDILMISYTNASVNDLKIKINKELNIPVKVTTFHKFGFDILKSNGFNYKVLTDDKIIKDYIVNKLNSMSLKELRPFKKYIDISIWSFLFRKLNYDRFISICIDFIKYFEVKGYTLLDFKRFDNKIISFIESIYKYYSNYKEENNYIDFEDMINKSYHILQKLNYKYIFIDEYQDISMQRFNLVKKISLLTDSKIVVVGDDWQSIYAFAGSNISLFTEFKKLMGYASLLPITNTYRNSQELIDIAGSFIMKNKHQITKNLKSNKRIDNPIRIYFYNNFKKEIDKILKEIPISSKTLIVGRYNFDINLLISNGFYLDNKKLIYKKNKNLDLTFLSVHTSKGLGFDNVIILCNGGLYGFPSLIKTDDLIKLVLNEDKSYLYAEERRLFYVALTRTKNRVYILNPSNNPSIFVLELLEYKNIYVNKRIKSNRRFYEKCTKLLL